MPAHQPAKHHKKPFWRSKRILALIVFFLIALGGIIFRIEAANALHKNTEEMAIANVVVMKAKTAAVDEEIVLPGNVQAWHEAPIYARTNGYLKKWYTDIGTKVNAGDLLAEIDTPEVDAQLHQAEADLATAEANNTLAQSTAKRWVDLLKTNSVSKQETDEKVSDARAKEANVASEKAAVDRLQQMEIFKRVVAPFAGTVTARNTDNGALITAGSGSTAAQELFHVEQLTKLRVYVQVPETYAPSITPDIKADLHMAEYPTKTFPAKLSETAKALDPTTRTLLTQFEVDNQDGALLPGGYAEVHIKVPHPIKSIRLPVNTLLFRAEGLQVATVDPDGKALLKSITVSNDYGKEVDVSSGITADDTIIVNPPDSLVTGQTIHVITPDQKDEKKDDKDKKEEPTKDAGK